MLLISSRITKVARILQILAYKNERFDTYLTKSVNLTTNVLTLIASLFDYSVHTSYPLRP